MSATHKTTPSVKFPVTTLADAENVAVCTNLRPDPIWGLTAVGIPRHIASLPGAQPVSGGEYTLPDGTRMIIVLHGGALKSVSPDGTVAVIATAVQLTDTPTCILPVDGGIIVMFASSRPVRYSCTRPATGALPVKWTRTELFPELPPLMFVRNDMSEVTASIPDITLDSTYTSSSQTLTDEDGAKVDKAMRQAYIRLSDKARARFWYIQPVFARYRLIGRRGEVLYSSAPVLVSPDSGLQATRTTLRLTGQGLREAKATHLTATAFVPALTYTADTDAAWQAIVRDVEIEVTPQLHPYSPMLPGTSKYTSYSSANGLEMRITLPGVNPDEPFGAPGSVTAAQVTKILDNVEQSFQEYDSESTDRELALLDRIMRLDTRADGPETDIDTNISAPHAFTAATVARSGDTLAWGGLKAIPFDGYTLHEMGIKSTKVYDQGVPTAVFVTMRDGSSVVRSVVSDKCRVTALSPVITYPSPDAVSIELISDRYAVTLPLTPSPGRRCSYYLAPTLKPVAFDEERWGFVVPSASPAVREYPSAVVTSGADSPFRITAVSAGNGSTVHTLSAAARRSNALTAPTSLFYAFSDSGISTVSLSDTRRRLRLSLLDRRGVNSPAAVTPLADGVAAIADGELIAVTGTSSQPKALLRNCDAAMLGWSGRFNELWCVPADAGAPVTVISPDGSGRYTREGLDISAVSSEGSRLSLFTPDGDILDAADEEDGPVKVHHVSTIPHAYPKNTEVEGRVGVFGEGISCDVKFSVSDCAYGPEAVEIQSGHVGPEKVEHATKIKMRLSESTRLHREVVGTTFYPSTFRLTRG